MYRRSVDGDGMGLVPSNDRAFATQAGSAAGSYENVLVKQAGSAVGSYENVQTRTGGSSEA